MAWDRVDFDEKRLHFAGTKSHKDRYVIVSDDVLAVLRRVQVRTMHQPGPFVDMVDNLGRVWGRVRVMAGLSDVSLHDLRRTYVTRLIRAGVPLPTVQKLAGHANIQTTLKYYNWVSDDDMRAGVEKLKRRSSAG